MEREGDGNDNKGREERYEGENIEVNVVLV